MGGLRRRGGLRCSAIESLHCVFLASFLFIFHLRAAQRMIIIFHSFILSLLRVQAHWQFHVLCTRVNHSLFDPGLNSDLVSMSMESVRTPLNKSGDG